MTLPVIDAADPPPPEAAPRLPPARQSSEEKPSFRKASIGLLKEVKTSSEDASTMMNAFETEESKTPPNKQASQEWNKRLQENLFHRSQEEETVRRSYESMLAGNDCSLLLVTGPNGSGKSRLVEQTLRQRVCEQGGYFITGKFDILQRPEPYRGFASAFSELTTQVAERGPDTVAEMRESIQSTVDDACVLTSVIPDLARIICGPSSTAHKPSSNDAIQRFVYAFRTFMRAISSLERPVVLLLDDLQFADPCSLDLLTYQIGDLKQNPGLFIVGTCDDSDQMMAKQSYLAVKLREMDKVCATPIVHVPLRNLDQGEVNHLLGNSLQLPRLEQTEELGEIVCSQTQGNIFYIIEFVRWLQDSGLLSYNENDGTWRWDMEEIKMTINVLNVGDFLVDKLELLPMEMRDVLKVAACFGSQVEEDMIEHVLGYPVGRLVAQAAGKGILMYDQVHGKYSFEHDGMQSAAYKLIAEDEKELFHLEVGRRLWRSLNKEELDHYIFLLLSQMEIGKRLITREKERYAVANLCLHAGRKAAQCSTFRTASVYLNFAIELLNERSWHDDYDLTLAIYNAAAEMELCTTNIEGMEKLTDAVLQHARTPLDKIQANATRIYGLGIADRPQEALDLGVQILAGVGERFPRILCRHHLMGEVRKVRRLLNGKSDAKIMRLPNNEDPEKLACLQIMNVMYLNALMVRPKLSYFIALKMVRMTLEDGLSMVAPQAFAIYGMLCISVIGDVDNGWRFGNLALQLLEQLGVRAYLPRVYAAFYGCIYPWKKPLRDTLDPLQHAHRVGVELGDAEFGGLCANLHKFCALDAGVPLDRIEAEWSAVREMLVTQRQQGAVRMSFPCIQAIHHYMGKTKDPLAAKGDLLDFDELLQFAIDNNLQNSIIGVRVTRMTLAYVFNDYKLANTFAEIAIKDLWSMAPTINNVATSFFAAMTYLAMARGGEKVRRNIGSAKTILKMIRKLARTCPSNFLDKKFLLEAELASVCRNDAKAVEKYICAISLAKEMKFLHIQAIANERMARHYMTKSSFVEADPFFREAIALFSEWKAHAKVERLTAEVAALRAAHAES